MRPSRELVELGGFVVVATVLVWVSFVLVLTLLDAGAIAALFAR